MNNVHIADADGIQKALEPKGSELVSLPHNLVDLVWPNRPSRPANKVFPLDVEYSGKYSLCKRVVCMIFG